MRQWDGIQDQATAAKATQLSADRCHLSRPQTCYHAPVISQVLDSIRDRLSRHGWAALARNDPQWPLLRIAQSLGSVVEQSGGQVIRKLTPKHSNDARYNSLSHKFGLGQFPLHTDTAFYPNPVRYLVMAVEGDLRRVTTVISTASVLYPDPDRAFEDAVRRSVWISRAHSPFYCSMNFQTADGRGYRYDCSCMTPANTAAQTVAARMPSLMSRAKPYAVDWASTGTLVLDNWRVLHGRGPEPAEEGPRELYRIYVR